MPTRPSILFAYLRPPDAMPSYVTRDLAILEEIAEVEWIRSYPGRAWRRHLGPGGWLPGREMLRRIAASDLVFQWFATPSAPAVGARLMRKPAIVVSGGFDVASVPELDYGRMVHPLTRNMSRLALRAATRVLAVSRFNASEVERWAPRARLEVLPHGFEPMPRPRSARERRVVSVGTISWEYMLRKGLEDVARVSTRMPEVEFILAGKHVHPDAAEHLRGIGGPNLRLPGFLPDAELDDLLGSSAVYLQLSRHEAFGCSVAEAMLAGSTPVLTRDGALPEVGGDAAYYVGSRDPDHVAEVVRSALDDNRADRSHDRISAEYPVESRRRRLHALVAELLRQPGVPS